MPNRPPLPDRPVVEVPRKGLLARLNALLSLVSREAVERGNLAFLLGLGVVDYFLPPEFHFSFAYLLPVGVAAWYGSRGASYFTSVMAAAVWLGADLLSREVPLSIWMNVWNAGGRLLVFLLVATLTMTLASALDSVRYLALSDPLTRLANGRAFLSRLASEVDRAARYGSIYTVAYLDLDRFKEVNDTLGHAEGDEVLRTVADTMRRTMRSSDLTARLGGDEFGILLPETPYGRAEGALNKLRTEILAEMAHHGWPVTVSMGAVTFEAPISSADDALRLADRLMYEVKENGADGIRHLLWTGEPIAERPGE